MNGRAHIYVIAVAYGDAGPAVEAHRRRTSRVLGDGELELGAGRDNDRPEGKRVRADGGDHDARHVRVDNRSAGRHRVRRATGRRRNDQAVALDRGYPSALQVQVNIAQVMTAAPVHHHLVQDKK